MIKELISKKFSFFQLLVIVIVFGIIEAGFFVFCLKNSKITKESHFLRSRTLSSMTDDYGTNLYTSNEQQEVKTKKYGSLKECHHNGYWYPGGHKIGPYICVSKEKGWVYDPLGKNVKPESIRWPPPKKLRSPGSNDICSHNGYWYPKGYRIGPYVCVSREKGWDYNP